MPSLNSVPEPVGQLAPGPVAGDSGVGSTDMTLDRNGLLYLGTRAGHDDYDNVNNNTGFLLSNYYMPGTMLSHFRVILCYLHKVLPTLE